MATFSEAPQEVSLQAPAAPVDTAVTPARVAPSNLGELAQSLGQFDSRLAEYAKQRQAQDMEQDAIRGKAAFYSSNGQGYADAVASGKIPAQASPAFVGAYKKAQGDLAGYDLSARFASAYDQSDIKGSEDPQAFTKFAQQFLATNLPQESDPAILAGILPHVHSAVASGLSQWVSDRHKTLYEGSIIAHIAGTAQDIEQANAAGIKSGNGTDYAAVFANTLARRDAAIKSGINPLDYDKALVQGISTEALRTQDPKLLDFLKQKVPGKDYTFADTPHGGADLLHAEGHLDAMARRMMEEQHKQQTALDKQAKNAATVAAIEFLNANTDKPVPEAIIQVGEKYDPEFRVHVNNWQKNLVRGETASNPTDLLQLHSDIINGGGIEAVQSALNTGLIKNKGDLDNAYTLVKSVAEGGTEAKKIIDSRSATAVMETIKARTMSSSELDMKIAGVGGINDQGLAAQYDFKNMLLQWSKINPNASPEDREAYIAKAGKLILESLSTPEIGSGATYNRPEGAKEVLRENPFLSIHTQPAATAPVPPKTATQPLAPPPVPQLYDATKGSEDRTQWFNSALTEEQRKAVQADAQAKGVPLDQRVFELQQQAASTAAPPAAASQPAAPAATIPQPAPEGRAPAQSFDMAIGDSIAVQQIRHGVPGVEGVFHGNQPEGTTGIVGAPPRLVLQKINQLLQANPQAVQGKTIFLSPGTSNDPTQLDAVAQQLDTLKAAGVGNVVVPGVGPGINGRDAINSKLQQMAQQRGFTYVDPKIGWQPDGVHPRDVDTLRAQALDAVNKGNVTPQVQQVAQQALPEALDAIKQGRIRQLALSDIQEAIRGAKGATTYKGPVASLKDNPKAGAILDFVAGPEGAGGNYNAIIGNGASKADLSKLTVAEVFQLQKQLVDGGAPSGAVGRYQFINSTLRGLVQEAGLPLTTKFTPDLQDKLGLMLLKRRGYDQWAAGQMSDSQFADNLAQEWASLPRPSTGKSAYEGVAGNRAGTTVKRVFDALRGAR